MNFEVVVVGASTAGLLAARDLAANGFRVAVFEARKQQEPARRTLIVTPAVGRVLGRLPDEIKVHTTKVMRVYAGKESKDVSLRDPDPIVERGQLASWLQREAKAAGAVIFYNHRFIGFETGQGSTCLRFQNARSQFQVHAARGVIGADGVVSDIARAANISRPRSVPILQAEVDLPLDWDPRTTGVWFDVDQTRFFFWLIPESESRGVIGLIGDVGTPMRELLSQFLAEWKLSPRAYQGARVALHHPRMQPWAKIGRLPVYLVGDSAGQVKVTTVGGTVTGFKGAQAAVRAFKENRSYSSCLRSVKRELDVHYWIRHRLDRLSSRDYIDLLKALSPAALDFLGSHDRDSMAPVIWRLPFLEPRLVRVGIRSLFRTRQNGRRLWPATVDKAPDHLDSGH